ncbi:FAD-binding oxidoreductase [Chitinophaga pendula]|uniref:NAD(P)/FAD-dependent oxidoreductase n=1 Tax=Chitinophaga TaxID=79328 RepID=UPI000BAFF9E4|nr:MULTISPECIES: FAD-binding oxidoreductase [Chitinophaga]ASZ10830.1 hypothetical protein CK934_07485 [Chitinophaga sp. MD30]UCJ06190.1 FAD-binding oxidoreductase [Chitinophaga pendula]
MQVDYIIVGQGIAGTMLSWHLLKAGQTVLVVDAPKENSASLVAAGVINPVSGRRLELGWLYETFYTYAAGCYRDMEQQLQSSFFTERDIWMVMPSEQLRTAFRERLPQFPALLKGYEPDAAKYAPWLDQPFGAGVVGGATVQLNALIPAWKQRLKDSGILLDERLDPANLIETTDGVTYRNVQARRVIFCEGAAVGAHPWFSGLRWLPSKGEVLMVRIPGFETADIIKRSITLVPQGGDLYWAGATFAWTDPDELPTPAQRDKLEEGLRQLLKVPYEVVGQLAAIRPSLQERRPVMGMLPDRPSIGIFNGMGTKGSSLAPYMAAHFTTHLEENVPLLKEVDIKEYFKK